MQGLELPSQTSGCARDRRSRGSRLRRQMWQELKTLKMETLKTELDLCKSQLRELTFSFEMLKSKNLEGHRDLRDLGAACSEIESKFHSQVALLVKGNEITRAALTESCLQIKEYLASVGTSSASTSENS